jgi:hypothetical protein
MEPPDQFYGDQHGGVKDSSGNILWIATHKEDIPPKALKKRAEAFMKQQVQREKQARALLSKIDFRKSSDLE